MKYDNGNSYEGQWKNNKRDGKGTTKYASGNVYTGNWKAGMPLIKTDRVRDPKLYMFTEMTNIRPLKNSSCR